MSTAANLVPSASDTAYAQRALFWSAANNFQQLHPDVPGHVFVAERDRALDERTGTALIPLDLSDRLGLGYPATVPNLLARYVRVRGGDEIAFELASSGEAYYVMDGGGEVEKGEDRFAWAAGDVFVLPGAGGSTRVRADDGGALFVEAVDRHGRSGRARTRTPGRAVPCRCSAASAWHWAEYRRRIRARRRPRDHRSPSAHALARCNRSVPPRGDAARAARPAGSPRCR